MGDIRVGILVRSGSTKELLVRVEKVGVSLFSGTVVRDNAGVFNVGKYSGTWNKHAFEPSNILWEKGTIVKSKTYHRRFIKVAKDVLINDTSFTGTLIQEDNQHDNYLYEVGHSSENWSKEHFEKINCILQQSKPTTNMKIVKRKNITITGVEREITLAVLIVDGQIRTGYSVRIIEDKPNDQLGECIAVGRALSDKTNLSNMEVGEGMDKKFILHAIADNYFTQIERGVLKIKGIKEFKAPREIKWRKNTSLSLKNTPDHDNLVVRTETDVFVDDVRFTAKVVSEGNRLFNRGDIFESFNVDKFEHLSF